MQAQREALAKLMSQVPSAESRSGQGRHRSSKGAWQGYEDKTVCEWFLCSNFCIFDILHGTKDCLGLCTRKHPEVTRESYLRARGRGRETSARLDDYEQRCLRRLWAMVHERDEFIELRRRKAEEDAQQALRAAAEEAESKTRAAEELGSKGHVQEAEEALAEASRLAAERDVLAMLPEKAAAIRGSRRSQRWRSNLRRPCEVCGGILPLDVEDDFIRGHRMGKLHQAWVTLRDEYARLLRRAREAEAAGCSPPRGGIPRGAAASRAGRPAPPPRCSHTEEPGPASARGATRRAAAARARSALGGELRAGTDSRTLFLNSHDSPRADHGAERRRKGRSRSRSKKSGERRRRRGNSREAESNFSTTPTHQKNGGLEEGEHDFEEGQRDLEEGEL